jgi:hypothetical protein
VAVGMIGATSGKHQQGTSMRDMLRRIASPVTGPA